MFEKDSASRRCQQKFVSRRNLIRGGAGAVLAAGLLSTKPAYAGYNDDDRGGRSRGPIIKPIPGGVTPFAPFGVFVHHNPLNPANALAVANISDPSQITDFDGFVGLTHIRGGGTGTDSSGTTQLAYQADMGFGQGKFIGTDGFEHRGTFAFV
jgi:hypothetical protein